MKRGFLLKSERKAVGRPTASVAAGPKNPVDGLSQRTGNEGFPASDLPSDYNVNRKFDYKEFDPRLTEFNNDVALITSIPQPVPDDEIQCEWIVRGSTKAKVLNAPGYPAHIPKPQRLDLCKFGPTPDMGQGLFAKSDIKRGELIFAERPLLVYPRNMSPLKGTLLDHYTPEEQKQVTMFDFERMLETTISRFPPESQTDFKDLHNSHKNDGSGPLLGIARTNNYGIGNLYDGSDKEARYGAVCKIASRINHSCVPNVKNYFKLSSFSMQFYAIRDIKAGDQLFYSYSSLNSSVAERQAELVPYGFVCKCTACINATPETDTLRKTFEDQIMDFRTMTITSQVNNTFLEDALKLEKEMVKEGLDGHFAFESLVGMISVACLNLGKVKKFKKYVLIMQGFRSREVDEE